MTAPRRRSPAKKQTEAPHPAPVEGQPHEAIGPEVVPVPIEPPVPAKEPEPEVPPHVRAVARVVRQHIGKQRHQFDAAQDVPVLYGYNGLSHTVNGHAVTHIATRDELSEMSDQQIYDRVMQGRPAARQGYPVGGQR